MIDPKDVHEILDKYILADGMAPVMDIENSHGSYLVDQVDGRPYLDMFSMFASTAVGYNHPYLKEHEGFLGRIAVNKPSMSDMYNVYYAEFMETFARLAMPEELPHAFFVSGGALAVENTLKTAFDWKTRKNMTRNISTLGSKVIHFKQAFHGRSGYTLSLTNTHDPRKYMYFPMFDWPRITNPKLFFPLTERSLEETARLEEQAYQEIQIAIADNPHSIAALILEPIQSEGGDNHFSKEFLQSLRNICDENDIFLIWDEVQTGIGITGKMWAYENFDVKPDALAFGKKTQVCGMLVGRRVEEVEKHVFEESSRINSTFGGNLVDMLRFKLILEIIEKELLLDNARKQGTYLKQKLEELSTQHEKMTNVRGLGLMCAYDMPSTEERDRLRRTCRENGMLILACGERSIRFRPHLNVRKEEIDQAVEITAKCLEEELVAS